jgi:hypothetical protein
MAIAQDSMGWRRFMERMISKDMHKIQETYFTDKGSTLSPAKWASGLVIRLLEITHGQWLYRCVQIHNKVRGTQITMCKEALQQQIEEEMDKK